MDWVALDYQEASAEAGPTFGLEHRAVVLAVVPHAREPLRHEREVVPDADAFRRLGTRIRHVELLDTVVGEHDRETDAFGGDQATLEGLQRPDLR